MSSRKKEYDELIKQRKIIIDEIKALEENEFVMRYLELKNEMKIYGASSKIYTQLW